MVEQIRTRRERSVGKSSKSGQRRGVERPGATSCVLLFSALRLFMIFFVFKGQFHQRVKQLMNRQKSQLKAKGQRMPSHSELKKPEQILKKRDEKQKRHSLQRARQARKSGRTNYRNKRHSNKPKFSRRAPTPAAKGGKSKKK